MLEPSAGCLHSRMIEIAVIGGWLAGESVPILGENYVDATARDDFPQGIEPESIQRGPGGPILELLHYLNIVGVTVAA